MRKRTALPGLRRVDHIGLVVPDLDAAVALFTDALGAVPLYRHGPYRDGKPEVQIHNFARHPDTSVDAIAFLQLGQINIELLQFSAPDQRTEVPRTSDHGGHHIALYVDDIDLVPRQAESGR
jgi:glyoxylase I family protein